MGIPAANFMQKKFEWCENKTCPYNVLMLSGFVAGLGVPEAKIWERIQSLAVECRETDLTICPTLFGERHNPSQRASVNNITALNTTLGSVYSSLCRGVIDNLHSMMSQDCLLAAGIHRIIGSGTAIVKNVLLQEQIRQQYKLPLELCEGSQADAAIGAAYAMLDAFPL